MFNLLEPFCCQSQLQPELAHDNAMCPVNLSPVTPSIQYLDWRQLGLEKIDHFYLRNHMLEMNMDLVSREIMSLCIGPAVNSNLE